MAGDLVTRAIYRACAVPGSPPHDRATLKIFYAAIDAADEAVRNTGLFPCAPGQRPVVIFAPGVNVSPDAYGWLAERLVEAGMIVVLYGQIAEEMPGHVSLSPGFDFAGLTPDGFGEQASASTFAPILAALAREHEAGPLAGALDLDRVAFGGHSAGGTLALINANPDWFPGLRAVFSYGAHTGASTVLGHPPETLLPVDARTPSLLVGGNRDGCIAASAGRYGSDTDDPSARIVQTFERAVTRREGDSALAIIDGANHFTLVSSADTVTGRAFLDQPEAHPGDALRAVIGDLIAEFLKAGFDGCQPEFPADAPFVERLLVK